MRKCFASQTHICLVGALTLSIGIYSLVGSVASLIVGKAEFDLGFLLIFIGLGLLRGSSFQRGFFGALLALNLVVISIVSLIFAVRWLFFDGEWHLWMLLSWGLAYAFFGYPFMVLGNAKNDPWFAEKFGGKAPPFVIPLTVALTLFYAISSEITNHRQRKAMSEIFRYDLELEVTDAETGEEIKNLGMSFPHSNFGDMDVPDWMKGTSGGGSSLSGYSRGGFEFKVFAKGYGEKVIEVNRHTDSTIEVSLNPNPNAKNAMD